MSQRRAFHTAGLDEDHAFHWAPGEIHWPHVRLFQRTVSGILAEPDHQGLFDNAAEHVAGEHECEAAEHLPLSHFLSRREQRPDPVGELLVVRHAILLAACAACSAGHRACEPAQLRTVAS
jgi:hypothetical protein